MMASVSPAWCYQDGVFRTSVSADGFIPRKSMTSNLKISFSGPNLPSMWKFKVGKSSTLQKPRPLLCVNCKKPEKESEYKEVKVEPYPYHSYMDSTSGQMEPASGARASIPGKELWPEGTSSRVRSANAPEPTGVSTGKPSFGKNPGSRRKKNRSAASASETMDVVASDSAEANVVVSDSAEAESPEDSFVSEYVTYQTEAEEEQLTGYDLDKKVGNPHPFIDPRNKIPIEQSLTSEELWWNWRKPENEQWSRWQRRRPDVETVFLKAMAETGEIKLYGDEPTQTECALYRARRHLYKQERIDAEDERLERLGPMAFYSEWVSAWKRDTSREAVQKHFEETGEDENTQLLEMFMHQTDREYRIMMGTDNRIRRDPLAMRMREDQIKQIWGGDPVYPTINYIQDPDEVIDYRGPDFHEPTPNMLDYLKEHGKAISRDQLQKILNKEKKTEDGESTDIDDAMARAVDIGETEDEVEDSEVEEAEEENEKITRKWSVVKSNPELNTSKGKPKPKDDLSLEEAIDDSENLTDFLLDFETEEE